MIRVDDAKFDETESEPLNHWATTTELKDSQQYIYFTLRSQVCVWRIREFQKQSYFLKWDFKTINPILTKGGSGFVLGINTLQETNISSKNVILKMIFLFPRWDMLIPWRVPFPTKKPAEKKHWKHFVQIHMPASASRYNVCMAEIRRSGMPSTVPSIGPMPWSF